MGRERLDVVDQPKRKKAIYFYIKVRTPKGQQRQINEQIKQNKLTPINQNRKHNKNKIKTKPTQPPSRLQPRTMRRDKNTQSKLKRSDKV